MPDNVKLPDGPGVVHNVGLSQGYRPISVRYGRYEFGDQDAPTVTTHWKLSDAEIGALLMGAPLVIELLAPRWPPSLISVGEIPRQSIVATPDPVYDTGLKLVEQFKAYMKATNDPCYSVSELAGFENWLANNATG